MTIQKAPIPSHLLQRREAEEGDNPDAEVLQEMIKSIEADIERQQKQQQQRNSNNEHQGY